MEKLNAVNSNAVNDWELDLPNADDLTPLSHNLISPGLMSAFNIKPTPHRSPSDVTDASRTTLSGIISGTGNGNSSGDGDGDIDGGGADEGSEAKKPRRNASPEDADSKRVRLVWTPQLHRRFVDVVAHLGIKSAVPKTIMQLMNVEGLTRENVASHLQKYRLYLKRNQHGGGVDFEPGPALVQPPPMPVQQQISSYGGGDGGYNNSSNNYGNLNYQYGNGVMQTGNNNMFGYHHNHPNHGFAPHVAPGEK